MMTAAFILIVLLAVTGLAFLLNMKTRPAPKAESVILRGEDIEQYDPLEQQDHICLPICPACKEDDICCESEPCKSDPNGIRTQATTEIDAFLNGLKEGDVTAGPARKPRKRKSRKTKSKRRSSRRKKS